jgi:pyrroloquinoline quinone (PQQ) biosynthesis protein C
VPNQREQLLDLYEQFPFHRHPLWRAVLSGDLTKQQVIAAEVQHFIRTKAGQVLRRQALESAPGSSKLFEMLLETYLEECTNNSGPSHLALIERLCLMGGCTSEQLAQATATPGNSAAMALYRDISARGAGCHMLGAGAVEYYYCQLSPRIYNAYTERYGMTAEQAETYELHGPMDQAHAERAFAVLQEAIQLHGWAPIELSVRDAFVATSLHYDGMLQAATQSTIYWDGRS